MRRPSGAASSRTTLSICPWTGATRMPFAPSCATSSSGSSRAMAETRIRSNGAASGAPSSPGAAARMPAHGIPSAARAAGPDVEHPVPRADVEQLDHGVHRARLAVGLAVPDVQRAVVARLAADGPREEPLAGRGPHRGPDAGPPGPVHLPTEA